MNKITLIVLTVLLGFSACNSTYQFRSPNDVNKAGCMLFLTDGSKKDGKITIQFENARNLDKSSSIQFISSKGDEEIIPFNTILYYRINNTLYYPKKFDLSKGFDLPDVSMDNKYEEGHENILFAKLITRPDSKILLFEFHLSSMNSQDGLDHYRYFISFPQDNRYQAWYIGSNKFFPNFEEKMSNLIKDCPTLYDKIKTRQRGYYLTHLSFEGHWLQVYKKIIEEYNGCK